MVGPAWCWVGLGRGRRRGAASPRPRTGSSGRRLAPWPVVRYATAAHGRCGDRSARAPIPAAARGPAAASCALRSSLDYLVPPPATVSVWRAGITVAAVSARRLRSCSGCFHLGRVPSAGLVLSRARQTTRPARPHVRTALAHRTVSIPVALRRRRGGASSLGASSAANISSRVLEIELGVACCPSPSRGDRYRRFP